jgi:hypothetical protein
VLAYLFWHRPDDPSALDAYERAQVAFHRSLAHAPPVGLCGSVVFRVPGLPWLRSAPDGDASSSTGACYEDWYLIEDYTALGVLAEAAVGRGHRTAHDDVARRFGAGAGGLYGLLEGHMTSDLSSIADASIAVWVTRPPGSRPGVLGELLGDGMEPSHASLWRRQLVLGPAPEYCLSATSASGFDEPAGVAASRLPKGWRAHTVERERLWSAGR